MARIPTPVTKCRRGRRASAGITIITITTMMMLLHRGLSPSVLRVGTETTGRFSATWAPGGGGGATFSAKPFDFSFVHLLNQAVYLILHNLAFGNIRVVNCLLY